MSTASRFMQIFSSFALMFIFITTTLIVTNGQQPAINLYDSNDHQYYLTCYCTRNFSSALCDPRTNTCRFNAAKVNNKVPACTAMSHPKRPVVYACSFASDYSDRVLCRYDEKREIEICWCNHFNRCNERILTDRIPVSPAVKSAEPEKPDDTASTGRNKNDNNEIIPAKTETVTASTDGSTDLYIKSEILITTRKYNRLEETAKSTAAESLSVPSKSAETLSPFPVPLDPGGGNDNPLFEISTTANKNSAEELTTTAILRKFTMSRKISAESTTVSEARITSTVPAVPAKPPALFPAETEISRENDDKPAKNREKISENLHPLFGPSKSSSSENFPKSAVWIGREATNGNFGDDVKATNGNQGHDVEALNRNPIDTKGYQGHDVQATNGNQGHEVVQAVTNRNHQGDDVDNKNAPIRVEQHGESSPEVVSGNNRPITSKQSDGDNKSNAAASLKFTTSFLSMTSSTALAIILMLSILQNRLLTIC